MTFETYPLPAIFVTSLVVIFSASEFGRRLGLIAGTRGREDISALEGSILGILALMLGFTFSLALSGFEARRDAVLKEANAIGTTALRARLLPLPHNRECLKLLQDYVKIRLDITLRPPTQSELDAAIARSSAIQEALWQQAKVVATKDNGLVPTGLFIQSLNDMIDSQEVRLSALFKRLPNSVLAALYGIAIIAGALAGYAAGLNNQRLRPPVYILALTICVVMLLIQDLDRPGNGFIRVSQQPMINAASTISGFVD